MKVPKGYEAFVFTPGVGFYTGDAVTSKNYKQPIGVNPAMIRLPKPKRRRAKRV
jgi:adenine-specific DNA glycosylase